MASGGLGGGDGEGDEGIQLQYNIKSFDDEMKHEGLTLF